MDPQQSPSPKGPQYVNYNQTAPPPAPIPAVPAAPAPVPIVPTQEATPSVPPLTPPPLVPPPVLTPPPAPPIITPPNPPTVFSPPPQPVYSAGKGRGHKAIAIILGLIILLTATGCFGYFFVFSPDWAIPKSLSKIEDSKKLHTALALSLTADSDLYAGSTLSVTSDIDRSNPDSLSFQASIDLTSKDFEMAGEARFVDEIFYGKYTKIPAFLNTSAGQISPLNIWSSLKLETIKKYAGTAGFASTTEILKNRPKLQIAYKKLFDAGVLSKVNFKGIVGKSGSYVRQYEITIDKAKLIDYLIALSSEIAKTGDTYSLEAQASLRASLQPLMENVTISPIIITTSLWSGTLESVSGTISYLYPSSGDASGGNKKIGLNFSVDYKANDSSFVIKAPDSAIPLDTLVNNSFISSQDKGKSASIKSLLSSARAEAEIYFDKSVSYAGLCKDTGQMFITLSNLKNESETVICRDSSKAYILAASLIDSSTTTPSYFCVDSTGLAATIAKIPETSFLCR